MMDEDRESTELAEVKEAEAAAGGEEAASDTGVADDEAIGEELARLQAEVDKLREMYLRKLADFDNYRKRQEREAEEFRRFANAALIRECLPVVDNLERALAVPGNGAGGVREGVELVLRQFKDVLARHGVVEIDPQGLAFDPALHEAIGRQERSDVEENTVIAVMQKGYVLGERLLRPALVVVAGPPAASQEGGTPS